ncbi:phospholipase A2 [Actinokineospora iranica]|uniref:Phospholipase A2 n=1 Tax=Actinokineospora iranica TaxID=1271860 RepID=A0A1G6X585_9PSEU|nr:phospholipase A2 [Actinokineospora iranica]SDD73271.1 phospholipase A2 [Actinokineospora iranica]
MKSKSSSSRLSRTEVDRSWSRVRLRGRLGWLALVVLAAAGYGVVASRSPEPPERAPTGSVAQAAAAIDALLDPRAGRDPITALPADFTQVTGVVPGRVTAPDGTTRAVHADGGCSTPWGDDDTRWDYSAGCKAHDLGYDLLRYASAKGQPLGAEPRRKLDERLSHDMRAQCEINPRGSAGTCRMVASLFSAGLVANSWHQRWGPPRPEPIGTWAVALLVVVVLLAVRVPAFARRRPGVPRAAPLDLPERDGDRAAYLGFLRVVSLGGVVLAESALALAPLLAVPASTLWPLTWLLQLVPLFFFAGGNSNLLAWQAARARGTGYGGYLAGRVCWLIRPVLAFVTAWLVVPLSLDLLDASDAAVDTFGRLVAQPLWLLGLYLLVVGATPVLHWLHRHAPVATPVAQAAAIAGLGLFGSGSAAAYAGGIMLAALFGQLAFHYADGTFDRLPRPLLASVAAAALTCLVLLAAVAGHSRELIAEPAGTPSFVPSALGVLLIGLVQVCLVALPGPAGLRAVARGRAARAVRFVRSAPMTVYLVYLLAMLLVAGLIGAARSAGLPSTAAVDWLARPSTLLALSLLGVPTALAFLLFEWRSTVEPGALAAGGQRGRLDSVAAALGTGYGAAGIVGFAVTGLTGGAAGVVLLGVPLDPMASIIHLLLGWYLLHSVRIGTAATPWPWLLTAVACVPPMITTVSGTAVTAHGATIAVAVVAAVACAVPLRWYPRRSPVPAPAGESPGG